MRIKNNNMYCAQVVLIVLIAIIPEVYPFGYDSATTCDSRTSRQGRAQLISTIPCDLTNQGYCNLPGSSYPWHAVRRFVHENQGLMRRMYGDVKHISILKNEITNDDLDVDDIEHTAARYSKTAQRKDKFLRNEYHLSKNNDVLQEPHFRPTTTSTTTIKTPTTLLPKESTTNSKVISDKKLDSPILNQLEEKLFNIVITNGESNSVYSNLTENSESNNIEVVKAPNLSQSNPEIESEISATISTTLKLLAPSKHFVQFVSEPVIEKDIIDDFELFDTTDKISESSTISAAQSEDRIDENIEDDLSIIDEVTQTSEEIKEEILGEADEKTKSAPPTMEGQLYQDVVQKHTPVITANMRGVNACPVKEEVVAPFWANNTRGEVLALLNLYPFEQYVHWEKCTNENKQMYCRDGCRCEQQYRLHRLLAYDPHNECRGIFSDWFRFPSCCICKCYDIPMEFRVTSRSPRSFDKRHPADLAEDELHKAIYNHATEDWYKPREDFN